MSIMGFDNFAFSRLRVLVEVHRTRWGITPTMTPSEDGRSRLAVLLSLRGRHAHATPVPVALCFECRLATTDLMKVAAAIVGDGCPQRDAYTTPCCVRAKCGAAPESHGMVNVEIQLAEEGKKDGGRAFCDADCIASITARLRALGARQADS